MNILFSRDDITRNNKGDMIKYNYKDYTLGWKSYSKPCFVGHDKGIYYEDLREVFYAP